VVEYWLHSRTKGSDLAMPNPSLQCTAFGRRCALMLARNRS
jgi:hypothetical protein